MKGQWNGAEHLTTKRNNKPLSKDNHEQNQEQTSVFPKITKSGMIRS